MRILTGLAAWRRPPRRAVVAIGMFDGVHVGHQRLIRAAVRLAKRLRGTSVVLTFHPDPQRVLHPQAAPPSLMPLEDRVRLISTLGVDVVWVVPFTRGFSRWPASAFVERMLRRRLRAAAVVVGSNFSFGKDRRGGVEFLRRVGARDGLRVVVMPPVLRDGAAVSSSRIRALVQRGDVEAARRLLGRPFGVRGRVVRGAGRGTAIGFPTANLDVRADLVPARGVYLVRARLGGRWRAGLMNIGVRPTLYPPARPSRVTWEVHLPGVRHHLYGRSLPVELLTRLRAERRFSSPAALAGQIRRDLRRAGLKAA